MLSIEDSEYLAALKKARIAILTGGQSYSIGSRSLTRVDMRWIQGEIARLEPEASGITPRYRRLIATDR